MIEPLDWIYAPKVSVIHENKGSIDVANQIIIEVIRSENRKCESGLIKIRFEQKSLILLLNSGFILLKTLPLKSAYIAYRILQTFTSEVCMVCGLLRHRRSSGES